MSGVAVGFVLSRTMVFGSHPPFKGILDSISQSMSHDVNNAFFLF